MSKTRKTYASDALAAIHETATDRYLNVTPSTVGQWERGEKRPRGASTNLLTLVASGGLQSIA